LYYSLRLLLAKSCPDPSDIAALDETAVDAKTIQIDEAAEALRPEHKRQAQEWAGIKQDPNSNLFVFVGRWSKQKGGSDRTLFIMGY
jgi:alpha-1,3-glucan synthase